MEKNGKQIILVICIYLLAKSVLNLILGFGAESVMNLIVMTVLAGVLICRIVKGRWIVGAALIIVCLFHLKDNLHGLPGTWIYLAEGILDVGAAAVLFCSKDVEAYMNSSKEQ